MSRSRICFLVALPLVVALTLPGAADATFPGKNGKIAFSGCGPDDCGVIAVNADGSDRTQITHNPFKDRWCDRFGCFELPAQDVGPRWSADGRHLAFSREGDIYRVRADGSALTQLTATPALEYDPAWSPDGRRIAFTRSPARNVEQPFVMNSDGSRVTPLADSGDTPDWSPEGSTIAYVVPNPNPNEPFAYNFFRDVHLIHPDGTGDRAITVSQEPAFFGYDDPSWSPDGRRIAVTGAELQDVACCRRDNDIWVMNADGGERTNLTPNTPGEDNARPVFSPDGLRIAAQLNVRLIVMNADGTDVSDASVLGEEGSQPDWQPLPGPQRSDYKNSAQFCKAEREFWGGGFTGRYGGGGNAYGKCVSQKGYAFRE